MREFWVITVVALIPVASACLGTVSSPGRTADHDRAAARYFENKADLRQLVVMLHSQDERLRGAREPVSLADLSAVGADGAAYRVLLAKVGATDLDEHIEGGWFVQKERGAVIMFPY